MATLKNPQPGSTPLTDLFVKNLRTDKAQQDHFDSKVSGFGIRVTSAGTKTFFFRYEIGRRRRLTLGRYPLLSVSKARDLAREAAGQVARGEDPQGSRQDARKAITFGHLAELYLEKHAKPSKATWHEDERMIQKDLLPIWGNLKAESIEKADLRRLLSGIAEGRSGGRTKPAPVTANRVLALVSGIFNFGIDEGLVASNPALRFRKPAVERARERNLQPSELRELWPHLGSFHPIMASFWKLILLTAQRPGEVRKMRWQDIMDGIWILPQESTKNRRSHRVPLSSQVQRILESLHDLTGDSTWVLESVKRRSRFSSYGPLQSTSKATRRLVELSGLEPFTPHDLRRTAATQMTSIGITSFIVEKILNHADAKMAAVYDRSSYDAQKLDALSHWADSLESILGHQIS